MSRFNKQATNPRKTTNHEGAVAYNLTPELELYTAVCTSTLQPKFYTPNSMDVVERIRKLISKVEPSFVGKLAVYARESMYLRSVPLVLTVELIKHLSDNKETWHKSKDVVARVIQRADEITELLSYYTHANERKDTKKLNKLSKSVQKGVATAFHKFDEYQFAKYNRDTEVKLRDALFLAHVKPTSDEKKSLFDKIVNNTLETPYTWEVELSKAGQEGKDKKKVWEELIDSKKIGYMALLRNLRNMAEAKVSDAHIDKVLEYLTDGEAVAKSKQLPFRFFSAYREMVGCTGRYNCEAKGADPFTKNKILPALEKAVIHSAKNIEGFGTETRVLVACDVSGSMEKTISQKSSVQLYDIGLLLGQILQSRCDNVVTGFFGDRWAVTPLPKENVLANTLNLHQREGEVGYSTNGHLVIEWLNREKIMVDKVMIFTDCQMWNSGGSWGNRGSSKSDFEREWNLFRKDINPDARLYLFDLNGYGNTPIDVVHGKNIYLISGWSQEIFKVLAHIEKGGDSLDKIKEISI